MMTSSLSAFLGEIGRHQLLTPEQELMMGRKVQAMVAITERCHLAGGSGPACEYSDEEKGVIRRGERAKNQMIKYVLNFFLVLDYYYIAMKFMISVEKEVNFLKPIKHIFLY